MGMLEWRGWAYVDMFEWRGWAYVVSSFSYLCPTGDFVVIVTIMVTIDCC